MKTATNWVDAMDATLGTEGEIIELDKDGDAKLKFPSGETWWYQPNQLLVHRSSSDSVSIKFSSKFITKLVSRLLKLKLFYKTDNDK